MEEERKDCKSMCQPCPYMMQGMYMDTNMMYQQQMQQPINPGTIPQQPMMGTMPQPMGYPTGRDEDDDEDYIGEDAYRDSHKHYWHHGNYPYMCSPYWYGYCPYHHGWHGHEGSHHHH